MSEQSKGRPVQPKCPKCGKALYKRMDPGGVKTSDPYGWCRNASCESYNVDQSGESRFAPIGGAAPPPKKAPEAKPKAEGKPEAKPAAKPAAAPKVTPPPPKKAPAPVAKKAAKAKADADAKASAEVAEAAAKAVGAKLSAPAKGEGDAVDKARERISKALEAVEATYSKAVIGLALAIVSQQMGSHEAANALIAEYDLEAKYGIKPR
jgi:outer membrane biosynthesis protein TonB